MSDETTPKMEKVKAIDVIPLEWALWCTVGKSEPFANTIEFKEWSKDGRRIWFMLDTHNFWEVGADEELELVPTGYKRASTFDQAAFIASRPTPKKPCATCNGAGKVPA